MVVGNFEDHWLPFEKLDPDEVPQNAVPHLRSKLFHTQIIKILDGNNDSLQIMKNT